MKVLTDKNGIILAIGTDTTPMTEEPGVVWLDGAGFAIFGQILYGVDSVPEGVAPNIYTYDGETFAPYISEIERIKQEAIDEYTLELIEGGLL